MPTGRGHLSLETLISHQCSPTQTPWCKVVQSGIISTPTHFEYHNHKLEKKCSTWSYFLCSTLGKASLHQAADSTHGFAMEVKYISSVRHTQFLNPPSFPGHLNPPELYSLRIAFVTHWTKGPKHPLGFASSAPPKQPQDNLPLLHQLFTQFFRSQHSEVLEVLGNSLQFQKETPKGCSAN